jgi:hypothetical protein
MASKRWVGKGMGAGADNFDSGGGGDKGGGSKPAFDLGKTGIRGINYGAMYLKDQSCIEKWVDTKCSAGGFPTDDLTAEWAKPMWSDEGRGDLANIVGLGANFVRLYGNDVRFDKKPFLDAAAKHGLQVLEGISSYYYNQGDGPKCAMTNDANCHDTVKEAYSKNLENGFLDGDRYHSALTVINVMNEPDFIGDLGNFNYLTAMVSAFDGILSAEKDKGVKKWSDGTLPRITITWSFAETLGPLNICDKKYFIHDTTTECGPGLTLMVQFYRVVMDPQGTVKYTPKNDLKSAFESRWVHGVNLFNPASDLETLFMAKYKALSFFSNFKVFAGEWHPKPEPTTDEFKQELQELQKKDGDQQFIGISYFQYQVAYQKTGPERDFGMFGLGPKIIDQTGYITGDSQSSHPVNCLIPSDGHFGSNPAPQMVKVAAAIAEVWKGKGATSGMCPPSGDNTSSIQISV